MDGRGIPSPTAMVCRLLLALVLAPGAVQKVGSYGHSHRLSSRPCPYQGSMDSGASEQRAAEVCEEFCSGRCSFFNVSAGEAGVPTNLTLYRMTPHNVTDAANKDLADIPGDIGFFLSRKMLRLQCARDPRNQRCFLAHNDSYASFEVEVDGRFGPYLMCNPAARSWGYDTSEFLCAVDCLTPPQCGAYQRNGTGFHGDYQCYCARTNRTVGRQPRRGNWVSNAATTDPSLPSQCDAFNTAVLPSGSGQCLGGEVMRHVHSSRGGPAVEELLCEACNADSKCVAWTRLNSSDGITLRGVDRLSSPAESSTVSASSNSSCISAKKARGSTDASTSTLLYGMGAEFGGYWYSLPAEGECARTQMGQTGKRNATGDLGTTCSWRLVATGKRVSAACLEGHLDTVVEDWNARCFDQLKPQRALAPTVSASKSPHVQQRNDLRNSHVNSSVRYTEAYLQCYLSAILGDPAQDLAPLKPDALVAAWRLAFESSVRSTGGCEAI